MSKNILLQYLTSPHNIKKNVKDIWQKLTSLMLESKFSTAESWAGVGGGEARGVVSNEAGKWPMG